MDLSFHTKYSSAVRGAVNIFLFMGLSLSSGSEVEILERHWGEVLGGYTFTYFCDTSILMGQKKASSVTIWDGAVSQLEAWDIFTAVLLGDIADHPTTFDISTLIDDKYSVIASLRGNPSITLPSIPPSCA